MKSNLFLISTVRIQFMKQLPKVEVRISHIIKVDIKDQGLQNGKRLIK